MQQQHNFKTETEKRDCLERQILGYDIVVKAKLHVDRKLADFMKLNPAKKTGQAVVAGTVQD